MKHLVRGILAALLGLLSVVSQGAEPVPEKQTPTPSTAPVLQRIVIAESPEQIVAIPPGSAANFVVVADGLKFLNVAELNKKLLPARGQQVTERLLMAINQLVEKYVRATENPLAVAVIPPQNIENGTVKLALTLGKFREIKFTGNRWYSEALLRDKLHVGSGTQIRLSELDQAINLTNNSPFRNLKANIEPIPGSNDAVLEVSVQERLPLRLTAMYDNSGNEVLGQNRVSASATYANVWGREHQATYQLITSNKSNIFAGHILEYNVPLPGQQSLSFSGSYLRARPKFYDGLFQQDGRNISAEVRYTRLLRKEPHPIEGFAGLAFKESNNNLEFGGTQVLGTSADVFQVFTGASTVVRDSRGGWALSATVTASPGRINSRNSEAVFNEVRPGASPRYLVGVLSVQRSLRLNGGWDVFSRAMLQRSSTNLLPSESLSMGGASTVRGYVENTVSGDRGFFLSNEINAPAWTKPRMIAGKIGLNEARVLFFYDVASVGAKQRYALDLPTNALASTGIGLRARFANYFSLSADYGWQILHSTRTTDHGRCHIKVSAAY